MKYILWSRKEAPCPPRDADTGEFLTSGALGELSLKNVYLRAYATYPDSRRPKDLEVGERIPGVRFALSGVLAEEYDLYRVS